MHLFESMSQGLLGGLGSGIISGGLGAIGSIFSNNSQKKENQRNREFTEYMYDRQYDNNIKLWNMQNKYDLPSAQKQRLLDAGLNADLMYSGKGVSPTPNLQAAVAGSPSSGSLPGYGGVAEAFNQGRLLDAQIRNIDADTKKKESETEGQGYQNEILKTDASFEAALKSGQVNVLGVQVDFGKSQIEVNKETVPKLRQEVINLQKSVEVMNSNIDEASERIANLSQERVGIMLDNYIKDQSKEYQIRLLLICLKKKLKCMLRVLLAKLLEIMPLHVWIMLMLLMLNLILKLVVLNLSLKMKKATIIWLSMMKLIPLKLLLLIIGVFVSVMIKFPATIGILIFLSLSIFFVTFLVVFSRQILLTPVALRLLMFVILLLLIKSLNKVAR